MGKVVATMDDIGGVEKTRYGTKVAQEAGSTVENVVDTAEQAGILIQGIAYSVRKELTDIEQLGRETGNLDQAIQENSARIAQTATVATTLCERAQALAQRVECFKLSD